MAGVQGSALAVAVSNAGGLGSLPCAMLGIEAMRSELASITAQTRRPFNVNFFCHTPPVPDRAARGRLASRARALLPRARRGSVGHRRRRRPRTVRCRGGRRAAGVPAGGRQLSLRPAAARAAGARQGVGRAGPVVGDDRRRGALARGARGRRRHRAGARGRRASRHVPVRGPDDAAGHLRAAAAGRAGGEGAGRRRGRHQRRAGVRAAMALGAAGVQVGTAYLLCPEATTSAVHRVALASPAARHTALTNLFTGRPARGVVNRVIRELGPLSGTAPAFPLAGAALAPLRAAAEQRRQRRLLAPVVRPECQRRSRRAGRAAHARAGPRHRAGRGALSAAALGARPARRPATTRDEAR